MIKRTHEARLPSDHENAKPIAKPIEPRIAMNADVCTPRTPIAVMMTIAFRVTLKIEERKLKSVSSTHCFLISRMRTFANLAASQNHMKRTTIAATQRQAIVTIVSVCSAKYLRMRFFRVSIGCYL